MVKPNQEKTEEEKEKPNEKIESPKELKNNKDKETPKPSKQGFKFMPLNINQRVSSLNHS